MANLRITFSEPSNTLSRKIWQDEMNHNGTLQSIGAFALKNVQNDFYIYELESWEYSVMNFTTKKGCKIFRYETARTRIGKMMPLISINMETGMVYFLGEDNNNVDMIFETKGVAPIWIDFNSKIKK